MKLCLKEVIKRIALLEKEKDEMLTEENQNCTTTYGGDEQKPPVEYSFSDTRIAVREVDTDIRRMKHQLHYANATVQVSEFGMTLGECIIHMAQLNNEKDTLTYMARKEPKSRRTVYGGAVEWTETNYSRETCRELLKLTNDRIMKLQMAIDRTNLMHEVEIEL